MENKYDIYSTPQGYRLEDKVEVVHRMYHVILCDDDERYLENLNDTVHAFFRNRGVPTKVFAFTGMEQISDYILKSCDIAILDIDFGCKKYSGLDLARKLKMFRADSVIIFASNYIEYAPEGYEVQAFRYVLKCDIQNKLGSYLNLAIQKVKKDVSTIKFQINGEIVEIPLECILYIESDLHKVNVYAIRDVDKTKKYTFYSSIGKLESYLSDKGFLRVHKSYLVNMAHIRRYQHQTVTLDNGVEIRVSISRYADQKEKYLRWKGQVFNG